MAKSLSKREVKVTEASNDPVRVVPVPPPEIPTYYVNNTGVETSLWDVCLKLGETIETDREQNILRVREIARIRMSPQHARAIIEILTEQLERYERDFGKIPAPKPKPDPAQR